MDDKDKNKSKNFVSIVHVVHLIHHHAECVTQEKDTVFFSWACLFILPAVVFLF